MGRFYKLFHCTVGPMPTYTGTRLQETCYTSFVCHIAGKRKYEQTKHLLSNNPNRHVQIHEVMICEKNMHRHGALKINCIFSMCKKSHIAPMFTLFFRWSSALHFPRDQFQFKLSLFVYKTSDEILVSLTTFLRKFSFLHKGKSCINKFVWVFLSENPENTAN